MSKIHVKIMSEDALMHLKANLGKITKKIQENQINNWISEEFEQNIFVAKNYLIEDFELLNNPESADKEIDFKNSVTLYETLSGLPRYLLCDERFWLWLHFEKFYDVVKDMMKIKNESTVRDHWLFTQGTRRGIMFGVLSRCYFRVSLTVDNSLDDKYELTKWVIENPERYRNFTWRSYSSEEHLVRGAIKGEKRAVMENPSKENTDMYPEIAKYISMVGSVRLLDAISEEDIEELVYNKAIEIMNK